MTAFVVAVVAYLLGSIPFGFIFVKLSNKGDIRKKGSGNVGATNALRIAGKNIGALTLAADALKGILAVVFAKSFAYDDPDLMYLAAFVVVLGHIYPVWLNFEGGKGVATSIAVIFAINAYIGIIAVLAWGACFYLTKTASLASLASLSIAFVISLIWYTPLIIKLIACLWVIVVIRHKENIKRVLNNQEKAVLPSKPKKKAKSK